MILNKVLFTEPGKGIKNYPYYYAIINHDTSVLTFTKVIYRPSLSYYPS